MNLKHLLLTFLAVAAMSSCKSQYETLLNSNDADAKYDAAFEYFTQGKYSKSAALFESLSVLTNGTERDDTVNYYWGLSNYRFKDYYTAEANFDKFIEHDMDAVVLANYANEHAPYAIRCFEKNLHVYSECISNGTMAEGVELIRAFEKSESFVFCLKFLL